MCVNVRVAYLIVFFFIVCSLLEDLKCLQYLQAVCLAENVRNESIVVNSTGTLQTRQALLLCWGKHLQ